MPKEKQRASRVLLGLLRHCLGSSSSIMAQLHSLYAAFVLSTWLFLLAASAIPGHALNIGAQLTDSHANLSKDCSRKCESDFCSVPPLLRYGKYCGLLYSGCPGEVPCDGLDACCMKHDNCIQSKNNDYLSQECSKELLSCMTNFQNLGDLTFKGNTCVVEEVVDVIKAVINAALLAGRFLHKP